MADLQKGSDGLYHDISYYRIDGVGYPLCGATAAYTTPQKVKWVRENGGTRCKSCATKRREAKVTPPPSAPRGASTEPTR